MISIQYIILDVVCEQVVLIDVLGVASCQDYFLYKWYKMNDSVALVCYMFVQYPQKIRFMKPEQVSWRKVARHM